MRYTEAAFEHTSKGPCFIAAKDKATAHRRTMFEISADHSRASGAGMPPPPPKKSGNGGGGGGLSGHFFLLSSVAQMFLREAAHSHWVNEPPALSVYSEAV